MGGDEKPSSVIKCIESWRKVLPDYKIIEWNESNFNVDESPYCKKAYENKKWAFVSDYVRLYVLLNNGGIYLDTDVELKKKFDDLLSFDLFLGKMYKTVIGTAVIGAKMVAPIAEKPAPTAVIPLPKPLILAPKALNRVSICLSFLSSADWSASTRTNALPASIDLLLIWWHSD